MSDVGILRSTPPGQCVDCGVKISCYVVRCDPCSVQDAGRLGEPTVVRADCHPHPLAGDSLVAAGRALWSGTKVEEAKPKEASVVAARTNGTEEALTEAQRRIVEECDALKEMLLDKNRKYGNSALVPIRIFSKASPVEQILVRLDDKLSRLRAAQGDDAEDVLGDLLGYLILLRVARRMEASEKKA